MSSPSPSLSRQIWQLIVPFWTQDDRLFAWTLLLLIIVLELLGTRALVYFNQWHGALYNTFQTKQLDKYFFLVKIFILLISVLVAIEVTKNYLQQWLLLRWRTWVTENLLSRWLQDNNFYHIETRKLIDNADQRISEDAMLLAQNTMDLFFGLFRNLVLFISFATMVWQMSGPLHLSLMGSTFSIPGYMLWLAILYALIGSAITHFMGRPLSRINMEKQRLEADFRFMMAQVRENAEQIALYGGSTAEYNRLRPRFKKIVANWHQYMSYTKRLMIVTVTYYQISSFFPMFMLSPRYFEGSMTLGAMTQASSAFSMAVGALSWFIGSYDSFYSWLAVCRRLCAMREKLASYPSLAGNIHLSTSTDNNIHVEALSLHLPDGNVLMSLDNMRLLPAERLIIRGPSGSGKSTLLRALAGIWPYGEGVIQLPADKKVLFLSQRSYLPSGTLKAALCYPQEVAEFSDARCAEVLAQCNLSSYSGELEHEDHWQRRLSPGEQQRLSFARTLLAQPDFLFLDEATSALDNDNEQMLYCLLLEHLSTSCIVSVAHRESLNHFHTRTLDVSSCHASTSVLPSEKKPLH